MDILGLIPSFGNIIYTLGAFVIALSVIVAVHEYGHYIVARWCGIGAEVFSLGFGPTLFSRVDRRGTVWQLAALPLGGYVRFKGDSNAASVGSATGKLSAGERRQTMHGAPLWARALTVAAGPVFNFILSIVVFAAILMSRGVASDPLTVADIAELPYAQQELLPGDEVLAIAGNTTPSLDDFDGFSQSLPQLGTLDYEVRRDGALKTVTAPHPYPPLVQGITPGSAAMDADLARGDVILSVNGVPISTFEELRQIVAASEGGALQLAVWRPGQAAPLDITLSPRRMDLPTADAGFETRWLIGISGGLFFEPQTSTPGPFKAVEFGAGQTLYIVRASLSGLYHMAAGAISSCNLRGPIGIAQTSGAAASQGWLSFVWFIAVLSTAVGLLNLFPIPVLDGGHLLFHAFEAVAGRPPSDGALRVFMIAGLTILGALMVFAISNDLFCP